MDDEHDPNQPQPPPPVDEPAAEPAADEPPAEPEPESEPDPADLSALRAGMESLAGDLEAQAAEDARALEAARAEVAALTARVAELERDHPDPEDLEGLRAAYRRLAALVRHGPPPPDAQASGGAPPQTNRPEASA